MLFSKNSHASMLESNARLKDYAVVIIVALNRIYGGGPTYNCNLLWLISCNAVENLLDTIAPVRVHSLCTNVIQLLQK